MISRYPVSLSRSVLAMRKISHFKWSSARDSDNVYRHRSPRPPDGPHPQKDRGAKRPPSSPPEDGDSRRKYQKEQSNQDHTRSKESSDRPKPQLSDSTRSLDDVAQGHKTQAARRRSTDSLPEYGISASSMRALPSDDKDRRSSPERATYGVNNNVPGHLHPNNKSENGDLRGQTVGLQENDIIPSEGKAETGSFIHALVEFQDQSSILAAYQISRLQAQAQLDRTTREYDSMQPQFSGFPGIMEQRQAIKERAAAQLTRQDELCNKERAKREMVAQTLADNMWFQFSTKLQSRMNHMSRDVNSDLERRLVRLEGIHVLREKEIQVLKDQNSGMSKLLETLGANTNTMEERIRGRYTRLEQDIDVLKRRISGLESSSLELKASQGSEFKKVHGQLGMLQTRLMTEHKSPLDELTKNLKQVRDQVSAIEERQQELVNKTDLDDLASRVESYATRVRLVHDMLAKEQENTRRANPSISDNSTERLEGRLDSLQRYLEDMDNENSERDAKIFEVINQRCHDLTQTNQEILTNLETIEDKIALLEGQTKELCTAIQGVETGSTSSRRASQFTPLIPGISTGQGPHVSQPSIHTSEPQTGQIRAHTATPDVMEKLEHHSKSINALESAISMLEFATREHKRVLDNVTTDVVAKQMMDQFSEMYPPAKNLTHGLDSVKSGVAQNTLAIELQHSTIEDLGTETKKLQEELFKMSGRVRALET